jgi:hypothetical protein
MRRFLPLLLAAALGCGPADDHACRPDQAAPYADGIPYLGIHADPGNSDRVRCATADAFEQDWHVLKGLGLTQPNTFSPDGSITYATTTHPQADGDRLHALDAVTGEVLWSQTWPASIGQSAVEVDASGALYFSVDGAVVSLGPDGEARWSTAFETNGGADAPWGVHFTPDGHVATVTTSGTVYLLRRDDGAIVASLSIPEVYGFVAPEPLDLGIDLSSLIPAAVRADIETVWGPPTEADTGGALASFLGAGGFVDNTLAISPTGDLYVVGGGPDDGHGALVQLRVVGGELLPGWYAVLEKGSASSPSVDPTGRWVTIADGASTAGVLAPSTVDAAVRIVDIAACDDNTDGDPDAGACAFMISESVERSPLPGAPAIDEEGVVVFYEFGLDFGAAPQDRDVIALGPHGVLWEAALPGDLDWNSVVTVSDNHIIGTASRIVASNEQLLGIMFPTETIDFLVILDRSDGALLFQAPIPDDSSATVTVGPDGSLYVGVLGLLSILSIDDRPDLGLVRFVPSD